ncbi:MAG: GIY-YIG nuclease family protein [Gammaproteobacteria bacterium]|nr:GIY-YIG nuclease family protein [Gammaproteobacteria bacterium]
MVVGGVFRVLERFPDAYRVRLTDEAKSLIGRLKIGTPYRGRTTRSKLEERYDDFVVVEILREPYAGTPFPGYAWIDLSFAELETIVGNERPDWKVALKNIIGIYAIADTRLERIYVGAAFGEGGVWSRWGAYVSSGDGGNVELAQVIGGQGLAYCRNHFRFTLLESFLQNTPDDVVAAREAHWKHVLRTRGSRGFNKN